MYLLLEHYVLGIESRVNNVATVAFVTVSTYKMKIGFQDFCKCLGFIGT